MQTRPDSLDATAWAELRAEFDDDTLGRLVDLAVSSGEEVLALLRHAIAEGEREDVLRPAHKLVGIFGQFAALDAAHSARALPHVPPERLLQSAATAVTVGERALGALRAARATLA